MKNIDNLLSIIYEDKYIIALNKPAGLITHPVGCNQGDSLLNRVIFYTKNQEIKIVHRLDKNTSGILIMAKNSQIARELYYQFKENKVEKTYLALVRGKVISKEGVIKIPLEKIENRSFIKIKMGVAKIYSPKTQAITYYYNLGNKDNVSLLYIVPLTGKKHQIRTHLSLIGHPIIGETLYYKSGLPFLWEYYLKRKSPWSLEYKGHFLHAYSLGIFHPVYKLFLKFKAPLPLFWQKYIEFI